MLEEIIVAGFGGQGVLSMGMTMAYAGMHEGKEVSWMPSYGPEMRGGTANCITIVSDHVISSPIVAEFDTAVLLNQPSMDKFATRIKPGGLLLYDESNVQHPYYNAAVECIGIPATALAIEMGNARLMNMIMLGALLKKRQLIRLSSIMIALKKVLPEKYHHTLLQNESALRVGMKIEGHAHLLHQD